jgi:S-adenosylmethionine hydrolase
VLPEFPPAVHLVVVDPGVGTDRAALVVRAGDHALVGPDNGVLFPPARALAGDDWDVDVYELAVDDPRSSTFHGRDVFAPGAAAVHEAGVSRLADLPGISPADDVVEFTFPTPDRREGGATGEVLVVDEFGNVVTNVDGEVLEGRDEVTVDGERVPTVRSYAHVEPGTRVATVGSHGNVELAVNQGRGDEAFGVGAGSRVELEWK